ncbi:MAG: flagellar export chaperone FliS [Phycisphaerales bacterium]|nr:flagellar export chaperone FliS [Phycisphaerales bacterium]
MSNTNANAYLRTKIMTASPGELRLMLLDGSLRFAQLMRDGIEQNDHEKTYEGSSNCRAIVTELITSLKPEANPALCERLNSIYTFIYGRLVEAMSEKSIEILDEVLELLRFERETWSMLLDKLVESEAAEQPEAAERPTGDPGEDRMTGRRFSASG